MSFQSLIAHSGHFQPKSSSSETSSQSTPEVQTQSPSNRSDSQSLTPPSNSTPEKQVLEVPANNTQTTTNTESLTINEAATPAKLEAVTLVPGFGESILTLLIASPFLLLGFKKWLHE